MNVIVDIQGFKTYDNKFILKEIAIHYKIHVQHLIFKPPFPFKNLNDFEKKQVRWIERNRGIFWNDGIVPYREAHTLVTHLLQNKKCLFTKGSEKVIWLKELLSDTTPVYNLEDKNCPNFLILYKNYELLSDVYCCAFHRNICALKNVLCLKKWSLEN